MELQYRFTDEERRGLKDVTPSAPAFYFFIVAISLTKACVFPNPGKGLWWIDKATGFILTAMLLDRVQSWEATG